ncbi:alpha/beta fold hydrolase [Streptomyces sp. NPDC048357]|uniref:alpha/beta fold hydrolase n=1 Tax=Streptomyces sp. NPDC048357 TaxID=3154719 RepID=UPI003439B0FC
MGVVDRPDRGPLMARAVNGRGAGAARTVRGAGGCGMFKVVSADGTVIACERHGDTGPALVLVGGTLMTRVRHAPLAALPARDFSVVNYDRRGRGDSGDHPVYDVQREIDDLDAVIERVGGPVLLFGMSSGAVLALEAVARGSAVSALAAHARLGRVGGHRPDPALRRPGDGRHHVRPAAAHRPVAVRERARPRRLRQRGRDVHGQRGEGARLPRGQLHPPRPARPGPQRRPPRPRAGADRLLHRRVAAAACLRGTGGEPRGVRCGREPVPARAVACRRAGGGGTGSP